MTPCNHAGVMSKEDCVHCTPVKYLYRFTESCISSAVDENGNLPLCYPRVEVYCLKFEVTSKTQKGAWINYYGMKKFVLTDSRKKFACSSIEEAKKSFLARKTRQRKILTAQLKRVEQAIVAIKGIAAYLDEK